MVHELGSFMTIEHSCCIWGQDQKPSDCLEKSAPVLDPDMPADSPLQRSGDPKIISACLSLP